MKPVVNICWFRRDLRLHDNTALYHALNEGTPVLPLFIFDTDILDELEDRADMRVSFIHQVLTGINETLHRFSSSLEVRHGKPVEVFKQLLHDYDIRCVFTNHDYEPYARERDRQVSMLLAEKNIPFKTFKDQVIFEKNEVVKENGTPYLVFTPYARRWKAMFDTMGPLKVSATEKLFGSFCQRAPGKFPSLEEIGFSKTEKRFPPGTWDPVTIGNYDKQRDIPSIPGTSRLSVHLRFGTISIRELAKDAAPLNATFLNELIWREFYQMILWHFPQVVTQSFKPEYDNIRWRNIEPEFQAWCEGMTGYPIVDAGMRELNETGFMHNRVRMITASFLVKHLLVDWRWGEAYFAKKLLDYDLASNNGGWQWAAGSGCDAAPYFRVFNPYLQTKKFDPQMTYVCKWVPEFEEFSYPRPIVEHEFARKRALDAYAQALRKHSR